MESKNLDLHFFFQRNRRKVKYDQKLQSKEQHIISTVSIKHRGVYFFLSWWKIKKSSTSKDRTDRMKCPNQLTNPKNWILHTPYLPLITQYTSWFACNQPTNQAALRTYYTHGCCACCACMIPCIFFTPPPLTSCSCSCLPMKDFGLERWE